MVKEPRLPKQTQITVLSGPPNPPKGNVLKSYPYKLKAYKRKRLSPQSKEISLFPIGNALSKQIPLKVNGFAETWNFQHLRPVSRVSGRSPAHFGKRGGVLEFPTRT